MARFEYTKMICFSQELCYDDFDKIPISELNKFEVGAEKGTDDK